MVNTEWKPIETLPELVKTKNLKVLIWSDTRNAEGFEWDLYHSDLNIAEYGSHIVLWIDQEWDGNDEYDELTGTINAPWWFADDDGDWNKLTYPTKWLCYFDEEGNPCYE